MKKIVIAISLIGIAQASVINDNNPRDVFGQVTRTETSTRIYNPSTGSDIHVNSPSSSPYVPSFGFDVKTGRSVEVHTDSYGNTHVRDMSRPW